MLKILQVSLQQYVNWQFPDVPNGFSKGRGTRDQIANIHWIIEKAREFQKNIYFCFTDYAKAFVWITINWKILKETGISDHLTCLLGNLYAVKKQHLETDMEQQTCSKLGKDFFKAIYCQIPFHGAEQFWIPFSDAWSYTTLSSEHVNELWFVLWKGRKTW